MMGEVLQGYTLRERKEKNNDWYEREGGYEETELALKHSWEDNYETLNVMDRKRDISPLGQRRRNAQYRKPISSA
ncbi:hypothetical protein J6590_019878 [Homalodisca vitripennis]|nr:hypothetical protein J6590_019878 [Homalodisca vitripennis]